MRARAIALTLTLPLALVLPACQFGEKYAPCTPAPDGNPTGTNGTYVLICKDGQWKKLMSVEEFVHILMGKDKWHGDKDDHGAKDKHGTKSSAPKETTTTVTSTSVP